MDISASMVKELREKTGVGMMECKKALVETGGDMDAAVQLLRERGLAKAAKKADRDAKEGRVFTAVSGEKGAIVELSCETDFVASNDDFISLGNQLAALALSIGAPDAEALSSADLDGKVVSQVVSDAVLKLGENIQIGRAESLVSAGVVSSYVHSNGKIGVLVGFDGAVEDELGRDVAMQVAAVVPQYTRREEVPTETIDAEKEVLKNQMINEGKPEQVVDKIVEGKINKYFSEICLLEQAFVKEDKKSVQQVLPAGVSIEGFVRYSLV